MAASRERCEIVMINLVQEKKGLKQYDELHCVTSTVLSRTTQTQVVETNNSNSMKWGKPVTMLCKMD